MLNKISFESMYSQPAMGFGNSKAKLAKRLGDTINPEQFLKVAQTFTDENRSQISRQIAEEVGTLVKLPHNNGYLLKVSPHPDNERFLTQYPISDKGIILAEYRNKGEVSLGKILKQVDEPDRDNTPVHNFFATA